MLTERDITMFGGPHYKPKHPVNIDKGVRMLRNLESKLFAIRESLEVDMFTYEGRKDIAERLGEVETGMAFAQGWVWTAETKVEEEACEIYKIIMLPAYVKRALVDAGYRTRQELYQHSYLSEKVPGIGRRGEEYIRGWKDNQDVNDIYGIDN